MSTGIILLAHGARNPDVTEQFDGIRRLVQDQSGYELVRIAFREFAQPDLMTAVSECVAAGADRLLIMPYFLFSGGHVLRDLPSDCEEIRQEFPEIEVACTEPLGIHPQLAAVVAERVQQQSDVLGWNLTPSSQENMK